MEEPKGLDLAAPVYRGWKTYYDALPKMDEEGRESSLERAKRMRRELLEVLEECCRTSASGGPRCEGDPQTGVPSTAGASDNSDNTEKRRDGGMGAVDAQAGIQFSSSTHPRHQIQVGGESSSVHGIRDSTVSREEPGDADSDPAGRTPVRSVAHHGEALCPNEGQDRRSTKSISVQANLGSFSGSELGVPAGGLDEGMVKLGRLGREARGSRGCGVVGASTIEIERNIGSEVGGGRYSGSSCGSGGGGGDPRVALQAELRSLLSVDRTNACDEPELHGTADETGGAPSSPSGRSTISGHSREPGFAAAYRQGGVRASGKEEFPVQRAGARGTGRTLAGDCDGTIRGEEKEAVNVVFARGTDGRETARGVSVGGALQPALDALIEAEANDDRNREGQNYEIESLPRLEAKGGSAMEITTADGEESLGVEFGNSGIWEHVEGGVGTPTGGTTMKAMIAGILVSVPLPPEAFCAWKKRAPLLSEQAAGPDLGLRPSSVGGASGNGNDTEGNRDMLKGEVNNDPPAGDSRFGGEWNRQDSVPKDRYPAPPLNARQDHSGDQGPRNSRLDGCSVECSEDGHVDNDDVGVDVHGDHRQEAEPSLLDRRGDVDAAPEARSKTWGARIGKEGETVAATTASTIAGGTWRALRRDTVAALVRQLGRATAERDRLRHQLHEFEDDDQRLCGGVRRSPSPRSRPHRRRHRSPRLVLPPPTATGVHPEARSPWRDGHENCRGDGGGGFGSVCRTRNTSESIFKGNAYSSERGQRRGHFRHNPTRVRGYSMSGGTSGLPSSQKKGVYSKHSHVDSTLGSSRESWCDAPTGWVGDDSGGDAGGGSFDVGGKRFVYAGESPNDKDGSPAVGDEPLEVPADVSARDSWERRKVAWETDRQQREREYGRYEIRVCDESRIAPVARIPAGELLRSPTLRSVRQAALIVRGAVRPLVRLALLSAWKRWRRSVLRPLFSQGRRGRSHLKRQPQPQPQPQPSPFREAHDIPRQDHGESRPPVPISSGYTSTYAHAVAISIDTRYGEKGTVQQDDPLLAESEAAAGGDRRNLVQEGAPVAFRTGRVGGSVDSARAWPSSRDATPRVFRDMGVNASIDEGLVKLAAPARESGRRSRNERNLGANGAESLAERRLRANLEPKAGATEESETVLRSSELSSVPTMDRRDAVEDGKEGGGSRKGDVGEDNRRLARGSAGNITTCSDKEELWRRRKEVLLSFVDDDDDCCEDDADGEPADGEPFWSARVEVGDQGEPHEGACVERVGGAGEKSKTPAKCDHEKGKVDDEKIVNGDGEHEERGDGVSESCEDRLRTPGQVDELCPQGVPRVGGDAHSRNLRLGKSIEERSSLAVVSDARGKEGGIMTKDDSILQLPPPPLTPLDDWPAPPTSGQDTATPGSRKSRASVRRRTFSSDDECGVDHPASAASFPSFNACDTLPPFSSTTPSLVYARGAAQPSQRLTCSPSDNDHGSSMHSHGRHNATPHHPPGSPGLGYATFAAAGASSRLVSTTPTPVSPLKPSRGIDRHGDTVAGGLPRCAGANGDLFAGRTGRRRTGTTVTYTPHSVRSRIPERKPTYLAPTASSRNKRKETTQVQSNTVAAPRKAFIPSGVARAPPLSLSPQKFRVRRKPLARGDSAHPSARRGGALSCDNQVLPSPAHEDPRPNRPWGLKASPRLGPRTPPRDQGEEPVVPWFDCTRGSPRRPWESFLLDDRGSCREPSVPPVGDTDRSICDDMGNLFYGVGDVRPRSSHQLRSPRRRSSIGSPLGKDCSSVTDSSDGICGQRSGDNFHRGARVAVGWRRPSVPLVGAGTREAARQEDRAHRYPRCFARDGQRSPPNAFMATGETRYNTTHGQNQRGMNTEGGIALRARALLTRPFEEELATAARKPHRLPLPVGGNNDD